MSTLASKIERDFLVNKIWFKNLIIYDFQQAFSLSLDNLQTRLDNVSFRPCGDYEWASMGWIPPVPQESESLVYAANECFMFCARKQEKILPPAVIRDFVADKIAQIEAEEHRKVNKREKNNIKEQITMDLLPRAFPRNSELAAYLDMKNQWLVIDTASRKKAEEFVSLLRKTLGSLPVTPPHTLKSPATVMTNWLDAQELPQDFEFGEDCKLVAEEGESVTCKQLDLTSSEVIQHVKTGKLVQNLALHWQEKIEFILDEELIIKRLKFSDIVEERLDEDSSGDFSIMTLEIANFLPKLFKVFGGLQPNE